MKVRSQGPVMLMGQRSNEYNGKIYYNVDVYDMEQGTMYSMSCQEELYRKIAELKKPAQLQSAYFDVLRPYEGRCKMAFIGWA